MAAVSDIYYIAMDEGESVMEDIVFDQDACAEFIFQRLIAKGIAVSIDDIRLIMELEYDYGVDIGIYPSKV